jgi:hypothetical protein
LIVIPFRRIIVPPSIRTSFVIWGGSGGGQRSPQEPIILGSKNQNPRRLVNPHPRPEGAKLSVVKLDYYPYTSALSTPLGSDLYVPILEPLISRGLRIQGAYIGDLIVSGNSESCDQVNGLLRTFDF